VDLHVSEHGSIYMYMCVESIHVNWDLAVAGIHITGLAER